MDIATTREGVGRQEEWVGVKIKRVRAATVHGYKIPRDWGHFSFSCAHTTPDSILSISKEGLRMVRAYIEIFNGLVCR